MIRRPPRSTLFPYTTALPICGRAACRRRRATPPATRPTRPAGRSEEHTSELQSCENLVCRLLLEKKNAAVDLNGLIHQQPQQRSRQNQHCQCSSGRNIVFLDV